MHGLARKRHSALLPQLSPRLTSTTKFRTNSQADILSERTRVSSQIWWRSSRQRLSIERLSGMCTTWLESDISLCFVSCLLASTVKIITGSQEMVFLGKIYACRRSLRQWFRTERWSGRCKTWGTPACRGRGVRSTLLQGTPEIHQNLSKSMFLKFSQDM